MIEITTKKRMIRISEKLALTIFIISISSMALISSSLPNTRQVAFAQVQQPSPEQHLTKVPASMSNTTSAPMPSMTPSSTNSGVPHMTNMNMMSMMMNMMNMMMNMPSTSNNAGAMNMTGSMPRSQGSNMNGMM